MKTIVGGWANLGDGELELVLDEYALIGGSFVNAPQKYIWTLGPQGEVPAVKIWGNDELKPEGTRYRLTLWDSYQFVQFGPQLFSLCGPSPIDLTTLIGFCGQPSVGGGGGGVAFATSALQLDNMFGQPNDNQLVSLYTAYSTQVFPPNFINPTSYGTVGTFPQATATYAMFLNGAAVGSISISPAGIFTFSTPGFTMQAGDRLTIYAPSPADWLLSDVALSIVFTRLT